MLNLTKRKRKERSIRAVLRKAPRIELLSIIADAVRDSDGCLCLQKPVCVFADDIYGEIPVIVRRLTSGTKDPQARDAFDIGDGYTTDHLDNSQLQVIVNTL